MAELAHADTSGAVASGAVTGGLRTLLRLEGLTLFLGMTLLYAVWGGAWWVYLILFLVPDLSMAAYLAGPKVGAIVYNAAHSYMMPMSLMVTGFGLESPLTLSIAMIWLAHRHRPHARLRPEIRHRFWLHPSRADRQRRDQGLMVRPPTALAE